MRRRATALAGAAGALLISAPGSPAALAGPALAAPGISASGISAPAFEELCTPTDPGLEELSGLAVADGQIYAIGDSGNDDQVAVLDADCAVRRWLPVPIDPRDVEDLAIGPDGRLWLADLGDNDRQRETVALIGMGRDGGADGTLHRLAYPDGPHDGEALLLGADGVPVIVTKELFNRAGVYIPADGARVGDLAEPGPSALVKAGTAAIGVTDTPGGPVPGVNLPAITGGAVSADGHAVALRTYTDVYLYAVGAGGIAAALAGEPIRVPLPGQPQGEAIAFTADGDLIAGSEAAGGPLPPLMILRGAVGLVDTVAAPANPDAATADAAGLDPGRPERSGAQSWGIGIAAAVVLASGVAVGLLGISRRRR